MACCNSGSCKANMDSTITPNICKLKETNDTKIEETFKTLHQKLLEERKESNSLRILVNELEHESALLEKEEYCSDTKCKVLEEEILSLKAQTIETASAAEQLKWKLFKINLIKEFEQKRNESTYNVLRKKKQTLEETPTESLETVENEDVEKKTKVNAIEIKTKIAQLKEEIEVRKRNIQMTDPKLFTNIKMLEKRNAALLLRYQRQLGEAKSRYRQTLAEVHSLKRILAETNASLADTLGSTSKNK